MSRLRLVTDSRLLLLQLGLQVTIRHFIDRLKH
jgi:hypothetical protein